MPLMEAFYAFWLIVDKMKGGAIAFVFSDLQILLCIYHVQEIIDSKANGERS